mmetsp:Transcript_36109/g.88375  ORF Transcript_36109/g.88375 Transcript_36109/m.88375 type:complete len:214 (-) Transcript_36109:132-773(-)
MTPRASRPARSMSVPLSNGRFPTRNGGQLRWGRAGDLVYAACPPVAALLRCAGPVGPSFPTGKGGRLRWGRAGGLVAHLSRYFHDAQGQRVSPSSSSGHGGDDGLKTSCSAASTSGASLAPGGALHELRSAVQPWRSLVLQAPGNPPLGQLCGEALLAVGRLSAARLGWPPLLQSLPTQGELPSSCGTARSCACLCEAGSAAWRVAVRGGCVA